MAASLPPALTALVERRRLDAASLAPLGGGNRNRRDGPRTAWHARTTDGRAIKLTVGPALADQANRHAAFARACPALVPPLLFHEKLAEGTEAIAEEFFTGAPLDAIDREHARAAFARSCALLENTERRSTDAARAAEWHTWTQQLLAAPSWTPAEHAALERSVLPPLFAALSATPATTRWTNGDFVAANLLVDDAGEVRLIDTEFAHATHFWREDAVRFHALSPLARQRPDLFTSALPDAGPAWHLFFWLRQWQLEQENNSADYIARVRSTRLATLRRLAEVTLGLALPEWSAGATPLHAHLEAATWSPHDSRTVTFRGWCHVPDIVGLRAIVLSTSTEKIAETALFNRPDVQAHFAGAATAAQTGFALEGTLDEPDAPLMLSALTGDGVLLPFHRVRAGDLPGRVAAVSGFAAWAAQHDPDQPPSASTIKGPLFSILLPVYRTPPTLLDACVASVLAQDYPHWELCLVDDASGSPDLTAQLEQLARRDARIRLLPRSQNGGIARATNDALAAARGDYIALLDHDDELRPHALLEMSRAIARSPAADLLYSDEDKISPDGQRLLPFLKPGFSPEFLLGVMYFGHLLCVRTALARRVGGFDPAFDGVQDFEFALRITEHTRAVVHVPKILYHWRQTATSSALHGNVKGDMDARQAAAVQTHLDRVGRHERAAPLGGHRVRLEPTTPADIAVISGGPTELLAAARREGAAVLLLVGPDVVAPDATTQALLAAAALRPDAGFVAPVLLDANDRIFDAGWALTDGQFTPLMRGFDPTGDGFNGSLRCTREVTAVSSLCVAIARERLSGIVDSPITWEELLARASASGRFHRVIGAARARVGSTWRDSVSRPAAAAGVECFYNPHFDPRAGDYTLRGDWPAPAPLWHLDTPPPPATGSGCLHWRGWCHWPGRQLSEIRLQLTPEFAWPATRGHARPDVAAQLNNSRARDAGFEARVRLPVGRYVVTATALTRCGASHDLFIHRFEVTAAERACYFTFGRPEELLAFQFLAGPSDLPAPLPPAPARRSKPAAPPHFAIVTPSFQQARFLDACLRSVLDQREARVDYVVQDGGSTDGSREVIQAHAARLFAWNSEPDGGQADAIVRGFAQTTGAPDDVMAWLNSDDLYRPDALATVGEFFARHPDVDVVYGHRFVIDETGRAIGRWMMPEHDDEVLRVNDFIPQETLFWRRRLWDRVGGIDRSLHFALDWDLLLRFQTAGARMVRLPVFLGCFRVHSQQKTSAAMQRIGQAEIDWLRTRTQGRFVSPAELVTNPALQRYLRASTQQEAEQAEVRQ